MASYQHLKPPPAPSLTSDQLAHDIKLNDQKEINANHLNGFIIYRKETVKIIKTNNERIPQPVVSQIVGEMWRNEEQTVKDAYKKVAKDVQLLLRQRQRHAMQQTLKVSDTTSEVLPTVEVSS